MQAIRLQTHIDGSRRVQLPVEIPEGPAELIVMYTNGKTSAQNSVAAAYGVAKQLKFSTDLLIAQKRRDKALDA